MNVRTQTQSYNYIRLFTDRTCTNYYLSGRQIGTCAIDRFNCPGMSECPYTPEYSNQRKVTVSSKPSSLVQDFSSRYTRLPNPEELEGLEFKLSETGSAGTQVKLDSFAELKEAWQAKATPSVEITAVTPESAELEAEVVEPEPSKLWLPQHKHGLSRHPLYPRHARMMSQCYNETDRDWANYGGKKDFWGEPAPIKVCFEWHDIVKFIAAFPDFQKGDRFTRTDKDGDFCPENYKLHKR